MKRKNSKRCPLTRSEIMARIEQKDTAPEMAVRLGKWCANGPNIWLKMQIAYDLWHAERRLADALSAIPSHLAA